MLLNRFFGDLSKTDIEEVNQFLQEFEEVSRFKASPVSYTHLDVYKRQV